jgi:hypothetical protein
MARSRKLGMAVAIAIAAIAPAGAAHAQAAPATAAVPVEIGAGEGAIHIELQGPTGPIACRTGCSVELTQGRYRLLVLDPGGHASTQWLPVSHAARLTVTPANRGARIAGIVTMGAGIGVAAVGAFILWATAIGHVYADCFGECNDDWPRGQLYGGAITLTAGAALAVTGLVIWRRNVHAVVSEDAPVGSPPGAARRLRLAPLAGLHLAGLGLTGSF